MPGSHTVHFSDHSRDIFACAQTWGPETPSQVGVRGPDDAYYLAIHGVCL